MNDPIQIIDKPNAQVLKQINHGIELKNVSFHYQPDLSTLNQINLSIPVGKTIALVGNSGGGKSTLVSLISRFYDVTKGAIMIDGIDIRDYTLKSLRDNIAVVLQDNFLFSGTIRENIMIANEHASEDFLNQAVQDAHLTEFVNTLPQGLDTQIGERGVLLSGGQKQRVGIARAFLKNAPILVLDEATSALDNRSEAVVQQAIDRLMQNRTVIVIAHRLSTIRNADQIAVINEGRIVECGTHDALLNISNGAYAALYHAQFKKEEIAA